jgi:ubiquinone/menaquinone biosynthesis C-methylase UbiE
MVAEAQKLNADWVQKKRARFLLNSATELSEKAASFTKIITVNTIYFWDNPLLVLQEFKRVLKPNGKLIVGFRPIHQTKNYPFTKYGFTQYSLQEASELLQQNGFDVLKALENKEPDFDLNGQAMSMENVILVAAKKD